MLAIQNGIKYEYEIINNNEVRILGAYVGEATELELSELEVDGKSYAVTDIGDRAFFDCTSLKKVSFPRATEIGDYVFYNCTNLKEASFPEATKINFLAFDECDSLEKLEFYHKGLKTQNGIKYEYEIINDNEVKILGAKQRNLNPFRDSYVTEIFLSDLRINGKKYLVTEIGESAFTNADFIEKVSFPNVTVIGHKAFSQCVSLEEVSIPKATVIGCDAFWRCKSLEKVSFPEATEIGNGAFEYCSKLAEVSIPKATYIGFDAFKECHSLKEASFPEATYIGSSAFAYCKNLSSISMPKITELGDLAFYYCNLDTIPFPKSKKGIAKLNGVKYHYDIIDDSEVEIVGAEINQETDVILSDLDIDGVSYPVTKIGCYAFESCKYIKRAFFPNVTTIGAGAFSYCNLKEANFPKVTTIEDDAFEESWISTVILPKEIDGDYLDDADFWELIYLEEEEEENDTSTSCP